jgi:hypothetical protein
MTDRELLELAAKAAGKEHYGEYGPHAGLKTTGGWWNPLTNSGDAFEFAVKLRLDLTFYATALLNTEYVYVGDSHTRTELHLDDLAATRRAIVRAAAEIGKEMKDD